MLTLANAPAAPMTNAAPAPKRSRKGKAKAQTGAAPARKAHKGATKATAFYATVAMGCAIPALALALSHCAGKLAGSDAPILAAWALALCAAVLSVSLPHLADAIADITRSGKAASWALAVAVDVSLVFCETAAVMGGGAVSAALLTGMMAALTLASMALNCWAFLRPAH